MTTEPAPQFHLGWIPSRPDFRDLRLAAVAPEILEVSAPAQDFHLVATRPAVENQAATNSCTGFSGERLYQHMQRLAGKPDYDGSEYFIYYNNRAKQGWQGVDQGATIRDTLKALAVEGCASYESWPNPSGRINQRPDPNAYVSGAQHQALRYVSVPVNRETWKQCIAAGNPVIFGMTVYANYQQVSQTGIWPMPGGSAVGGHALVCDAYDETYAHCPGSWGSSIANGGVHKVPWAYIEMAASDAWILQEVEGDVPLPPSPPPAPGPEPAPPAPAPATDPWVRFYTEFTHRSGKKSYASGDVDLPPGG